MEIMSSSINSNSKQSLQDEVQRLALAANHTFELFRTYSIRSTDCTVARNELTVAARQTKTRCDKLLSEARVTLRPEIRQSLLEISVSLEHFALFFDSYSKDAPLPQELFIELRTHVGNVAPVFVTVDQLTDTLLREMEPNAGGWNQGTLLETLKASLLDLIKWCLEHNKEIADVLQMGGAALSKSSILPCKFAGMALCATGTLLNTIEPRLNALKTEFSSPAATGGPHFDGSGSESKRQQKSSVSKRQNTRERFCDEYPVDDRDELEQLVEATRLSLQFLDASAESPSASPGKEPLLSMRSQNFLTAQLGGNFSEPDPKNAEGSNKRAASEAIFRTRSSSSLSENDLNSPATVPKSESGAGKCPNEANASFGSSESTDTVAQCSVCERPLKSHWFVCPFNHGKGDTDQVFCKACIHTCPPEHVHLLVRDLRPLTSGECGRFNLLVANKGFHLANGGVQQKHIIKCISCDKRLDVEVRYKCLECRASDLCAECLLSPGKHCEIIEEINKSRHVFLVLRQGTPFNKNIFDLLF